MNKELNFILKQPFKSGFKFGLGIMTAWFTVELLFRFIVNILDIIMFSVGGPVG